MFCVINGQYRSRCSCEFMLLSWKHSGIIDKKLSGFAEGLIMAFKLKALEAQFSYKTAHSNIDSDVTLAQRGGVSAVWWRVVRGLDRHAAAKWNRAAAVCAGVMCWILSHRLKNSCRRLLWNPSLCGRFTMWTETSGGRMKHLFLFFLHSPTPRAPCPTWVSSSQTSPCWTQHTKTGWM